MEKNYRHEYKYLISTASAYLLEKRLRSCMQIDTHAGPTGCYTIRSLYFDDFENTALYEKIDGLNDRVKYRIRMYNGNLQFLRLERKEKKGSMTRKTGQTLPVAVAEALQNGQLAPDVSGLALELSAETRIRGLRPKVLVDYDRVPFVCPEGNTRITLDKNLRTKPYIVDLNTPSDTMIHVLEPNQTILEVKFDDFLPGYLSAVLSDIPKVQLAISKFALCMSLFE